MIFPFKKHNPLKYILSLIIFVVLTTTIACKNTSNKTVKTQSYISTENGFAITKDVKSASIYLADNELMDKNCNRDQKNQLPDNYLGLPESYYKNNTTKKFRNKSEAF